ncbi:D-alanyl-D-alanine carboxypeptidase family protein [Cellulosilyticum ruminicola]|uniref:D-alanyl-D-alanine carboxypeptidase family protein n=1 Tax=Cellulosilyticum ruminicola TaxID=425254 RepID=UPI0009F81A30|nr:D-alanyl-D-alanine carboxypeptidase family protein [Cellulosilyticum ruminicola]
MRRSLFIWLLTMLLCASQVFAAPVSNEVKTNNTLAETSRSYILMEESSGKVLLEKEADTPYPPASITKIMTLLLINDAIAQGKINWDDKVTISEHAAHMGGSQVFMEPGEEQTVRDLVKCICIASANDAAVAMSEYIAGSEEQFVQMMNDKAKELGMQNTTFKNACGLHVEGHVSCARDIAIMSRELVKNYPEITKIVTIWMDSIIHRTRRGESEFVLSNTNKMLKWYSGITGLKTGYTPEAKHCVSATATRDNMGLIAVIMGAQDGKIRFREAAQLLDYGFANYKVKKGPEMGTIIGSIPVKKGTLENLNVVTDETKGFVVPKSGSNAELTYEIVYTRNSINAPIKKGEVVGSVTYYLEGEVVGEGNIVAAIDVEKATFKQMLPYTFKRFFRISKEEKAQTTEHITTKKEAKTKEVK